jgi:hypothetical protein
MVVEEILPKEVEIIGAGDVRCYSFGKTRHMSWDYPEKKKEGGGESRIS